MFFPKYWFSFFIFLAENSLREKERERENALRETEREREMERERQREREIEREREREKERRERERERERKANDLFKQAMAKGGRSLNSSRLCLVGQGRAGKTALARVLRNKNFESTVSTIGVSQFFVEVDNKVCLAAGHGGQWNELDEGESTLMSQEQALASRAAELAEESTTSVSEGRQLTRQESLSITDLLDDDLCCSYQSEALGKTPQQQLSSGTEDGEPKKTSEGATTKTLQPVAESTTAASESTKVSSSNIELIAREENPPESHQTDENPLDSHRSESIGKTPQKNNLSSGTQDSESNKSAQEEPTTPQTLPNVNQEKVLERIREDMEFCVPKSGTKESMGSPFISVPVRLSLWDYGGQDKFIGMHHLYLSRYCVYLLVFNMQWLHVEDEGASQKDNCLEYLTGWLDSISMHSVSRKDKSQAPILIIGSHKDKVRNSEDHDNISKILEGHFKNHRAWKWVKKFKKSQEEAGQRSLYFFPVDNTRGQHHEKGPDPVHAQMRSTVLELVGRENYFKRTVPYTWLGAYETLQKETNSCLGFEKVKDICARNRMGTTLELNHETAMMLKFFHQMGLIMYHDEKALKHLVVLDPARFLVEPASRVVCQHDTIESDDYSPPEERRVLMQDLESQKPHQCEDLRKGILHREILREFLWSDIVDNQDELELLMTKYQLMVPLTNEDENEDRFLVPAVLLPEQQRTQVNDHRAALKWKEAGSEKPFTGTEIKNELLAAALEKKIEFKKEEWDVFQVADLSSDSYIKAGNRYFKPVRARLVGYFIFGHREIIEEYRKKGRGYVSVDEAKRKGFLPKGLFAAVLCSIVSECELVHGMSFSDMKMTTSSISTAFGRHEFVLRQMPENKMMELSLMVDSPLHVVDRLLKLIAEAVSKLMPSLRFAVCIDQEGGACRDGQVTKPTGSLVILDGDGGLEQRLRISTPNEYIKVAPRLSLSADEAREKFGRWLIPVGLIDGKTSDSYFEYVYHVFLSYRWGNFDSELVNALFFSLCTSVIGDGRQVHVFRDENRLEEGRIFSSDFAKALINSLVVVPVVSYAALVRMFDLKPDSEIDNVLLEWMLIYELLERHHLKFCLPIMVGEVKENSKDGKFIESNLMDCINCKCSYASRCPAHCIGLKWEKVGSEKPETGTEIENGELLAALQQGKVEFRKEEIEAFKSTDLSHESYIKVDASTYFKPCKGDCRCKFLPEVVCTKVADRVNELLVENGMPRSERVHQYTVRDVVKKVTSALGFPAWEWNPLPMNLTLDIDFQAVGQEGSTERRIFTKGLKKDLADASGTWISDFHILKVSPGSVVVDMNAPDKAAREIYKQSLDPNSRLREGKFTRFTDKITLQRPDSVPEIPVPLTAAPATHSPAFNGGSSDHIDTLECAQHAAPLKEKARYTTAQAAAAIPQQQQRSKLHIEMDWKKGLYTHAAHKVLMCVEKAAREREKEAAQKVREKEAAQQAEADKAAEQAAGKRLLPL
jgi:GTPase SAR1 family protein